MPQFHETGMGRKFYEADVQHFKDILSDISEELRKANQLKEKELKLKERQMLMDNQTEA